MKRGIMGVEVDGLQLTRDSCFDGVDWDPQCTTLQRWEHGLHKELGRGSYWFGFLIVYDTPQNLAVPRFQFQLYAFFPCFEKGLENMDFVT